MNTRSSSTAHRRGILLGECLMYLGVTALLVGLGMALFLRCLDTATGLSRNADDIARALSLGERWRADLRLATAAPRFPDEHSRHLLIPQTNGGVTYLFSDETIWRRREGDPTWTRLLERVAHAEWNTDPRDGVTAWHFDLELKSRKPNARLRPLFSFIGVATAEASP